MAIPVLAPTQVSNSELQMSSISSSASVDGAALKISGEVMVGAVIFLFMVLVFVIFLYLYARRHLGATFGLSGASNSRRRHMFVPTNATPRRHGLDESVLHSLPIATFCSDDDNFKDGLECAVCLSDISDGEKFRLLPKCNHGFHVECIDMWFFSNSTCPLCRSSVGCPQHDMLNAVLSTPPATHTEAEAEAEAAEADVSPAEFPTNVLICGTRNQVESSSSISHLRPEGMLVIDIPRRAMEGFSFSSPVSPFMSKSPASASDMKSPASAKFKAFRRLMSFGKRSAAAGPSTSWSSPREGGDVELGQGVLQTATTTPRTPPPPPPMCS